MTLAQLCWISTAAYGLHIFEELVLDWRGWVRSIFHIEVDWSTFYVGNALVLLLGIVAADLAPSLPVLSLALPAVMLLNAIFFHIAGFVLLRGRFSPGMITAVLLFLPLGAACYRVAWRNGVVSATGLTESWALGAVLMASPIVLMKLKTLKYFRSIR